MMMIKGKKSFTSESSRVKRETYDPLQVYGHARWCSETTNGGIFDFLVRLTTTFFRFAHIFLIFSCLEVIIEIVSVLGVTNTPQVSGAFSKLKFDSKETVFKLCGCSDLAEKGTSFFLAL